MKKLLPINLSSRFTLVAVFIVVIGVGLPTVGKIFISVSLKISTLDVFVVQLPVTFIKIKAIVEVFPDFASARPSQLIRLIFPAPLFVLLEVFDGHILYSNVLSIIINVCFITGSSFALYAFIFVGAII